MQKPRQNGTTGGSNSGQPNQPRDELDVAAEFVNSSGYEELLRDLNLGTGNYSPQDLAMQMRSFRKGMVAAVAFDSRLFDRAVYETKIKLADEGYQYEDEEGRIIKFDSFEDLDDETVDEKGGRGPALRERGEKLWSRLAEPGVALSDAQAAALSQKVGIERFKPVFWRLMAVYHEGSKSRNARTQDNFFGRVKKHLVDDNSEADLGGSIFERGGNR
ncbi:hypothetical protein EI982_14600 [Haloplanus rallus]|uniref:Uncharacterized protein n=1 Tax=Haloplanus rallus TaxID=1816183 RepID=A0A6B9FAX5_9EURY|nr:hypothetical protein [Haloplanus rallus]QGX95927.1 hypothetical protein EI982_14600 [Haloplanus rallus]